MFTGKKVVITGGSAGIGFATAKLFSERGAEVLITGRNQEKLEEALRRLKSPNVHALAWDVANFDVLDEKFKSCIELLGSIDIWINNAGLAMDVDFQGDFFGTKEFNWDTVMDTNIKSMFFICQKLISYMKQNHIAGRIVNVGSEQGFRPGAITPYGISKICVDYLTKGLARKFVKDGIIINSVAPGATNTDLQYAEKIMSAEEIAEVILFLASDRGKIIAGETVIADRCEHLGVSWYE